MGKYTVVPFADHAASRRPLPFVGVPRLGPSAGFGIQQVGALVPDVDRQVVVELLVLVDTLAVVVAHEAKSPFGAADRWAVVQREQVDIEAEESLVGEVVGRLVAAGEVLEAVDRPAAALGVVGDKLVAAVAVVDKIVALDLRAASLLVAVQPRVAGVLAGVPVGAAGKFVAGDRSIVELGVVAVVVERRLVAEFRWDYCSDDPH